MIDVATGQPLNSLVKNTGKLSANGGRVELTAAQARTVVDSVINNTGVIEARTVGTRNGKIVLGGSTTKVAGLPTQTVKVSGKLDVSAKGAKGKGGTIQVTGEQIVVQAASFDASGPTGGGKVLIGGDTGGGGNTGRSRRSRRQASRRRRCRTRPRSRSTPRPSSMRRPPRSATAAR